MQCVDVTYNNVTYRLLNLNDELINKIQGNVLYRIFFRLILYCLDENAFMAYFHESLSSGKNIEIVSDDGAPTDVQMEPDKVLEPVNNEIKTPYCDPCQSNNHSPIPMPPFAQSNSNLSSLSEASSHSPISNVGTPTGNGKRKYMQKTSSQRKSYRKLDDDEEQERFDEILVTLVMDRPQLSNIRLDPGQRTKEKVAYAWKEVQEALSEGKFVF